MWSFGHGEWSNAESGECSRSVATGGQATGGLPRLPTVCICIRVGLCVHFCGSCLRGGRWGREGGGVQGWASTVEERIEGVVVVCLCVSTPLAVVPVARGE